MAHIDKHTATAHGAKGARGNNIDIFRRLFCPLVLCYLYHLLSGDNHHLAFLDFFIDFFNRFQYCLLLVNVILAGVFSILHVGQKQFGGKIPVAKARDDYDDHFVFEVRFFCYL